MINEYITTRNEHIVQLRRNGLTLDEIGGHFSLSRERVRQIIKNVISGSRYNIPPNLTYQRMVIDCFQCQLCQLKNGLSTVIINLNKPLELDNIATVCHEHKRLVMAEHHKEYPSTIQVARVRKEWRCAECGGQSNINARYCSSGCRRLGRCAYLKTGIKRCSSCKIDKPLAEFYHRPSKNWYASYCKICFNKITRPAADKRNRSEAGKAYFKRYNHEHRAAISARQRALYWADPEKSRARYRGYYAKKHNK